MTTIYLTHKNKFIKNPIRIWYSSKLKSDIFINLYFLKILNVKSLNNEMIYFAIINIFKKFR